MLLITMTDEEYLKNKPKSYREEIRAINAEYLGSYLYRILNPEPISRLRTSYTKEQSKALSIHQYKECVDKLHETHKIDDGELLLLYDLIELPLIPNSTEDTKAKIREVLKTEKPDWLGDV